MFSNKVLYNRDMKAHRFSAATNDSIRTTITYMYLAMAKMDVNETVNGIVGID